MKLEKIPLKTFIDTLVGLYNKGVDYIDIYKKNNEKGEPSVYISFTKEYMNPSLIEEDEEIPPPIEEKDFNDLT